MYSNSASLVRWAVIIYLQNKVCSFISSIPSEECPYHNLGFSLVGFTSFHLNRFRSSYVTVALFRESHPYSVRRTLLELRIYPRRQRVNAKPRLILSPSTNTTVISEPCEHGLSSTMSSIAAIT